MPDAGAQSSLHSQQIVWTQSPAERGGMCNVYSGDGECSSGREKNVCQVQR